MPRLLGPLPLVAALLMLLLPLWTLQSGAAELESNRQADKLRGRAKEELSAQSLLDIYVGCIAPSLGRESDRGIATTTLGDIRRLCSEERKNLSMKVSQRAVNVIDNRLMEGFNTQRRGSDVTVD